MQSVGVLALQGSFSEHLTKLAQLTEVLPVAVKTAADLEQVDRLILPGGESTAISRLLQRTGLSELLKRRVKEGLPVWGTCAGLILLAKNIVGEQPHLGVMDITVRRNAYGSQLDSFSCRQLLPALGTAATCIYQSSVDRKGWRTDRNFGGVCRAYHSCPARKAAGDQFSPGIDRQRCCLSLFSAAVKIKKRSLHSRLRFYVRNA